MKLETDAITANFRTRRREQETLRIARVALALFLERGPDNVTAEEIADAAHISRRTFFRYFPSKDDILVMVHGRSMQRVADRLRDRPPEEAFIRALVNASRAMADVELDREEADLRDVSTRLLARYPNAWERIIWQAGREIEQRLEKALAFRLAESGGDVASARPLAAIAWGVGCSVFREWLADGASDSVPDRIEIALERIRLAL